MGFPKQPDAAMRRSPFLLIMLTGNFSSSLLKAGIVIRDRESCEHRTGIPGHSSVGIYNTFVEKVRATETVLPEVGYEPV